MVNFEMNMWTISCNRWFSKRKNSASIASILRNPLGRNTEQRLDCYCSNVKNDSVNYIKSYRCIGQDAQCYLIPCFQ